MTILSLFALLFICIFIGIPISISLGLSSVVTLLFFSDDSLASIALKLFEATSEHYTLLAIPFFVLASAFLSTGGVARHLINFATNSIGHVRGGLAMASVLACMLFAAISGSSPATVAAIGSIVIAGMVRAGYTEKFAAGVIGTAGTLGILIPPSIVMLVYAAATEVSVTKMFMAGLIPGIMMGSILMVAIYIVAHIKNFPAQSFPGFKIWGISALKALGGLMLIIIILGTIYGGIASPTEAAAVSVVYAWLVCIWGYRDIGPLKGKVWIHSQKSTLTNIIHAIYDLFYGMVHSFKDKEINKVVLDSAKINIMLLFVIANAMLFAHVLTTERIPHTIAEVIISWGLPVWGFLIVVNILLLIAGNFMEPSAIILIMAPILFPIAMQLGIDPIHLGIIIVVNMEIGMLTPPVGLNLFVTAGITKNSIGWAIRATFPWLGLLLIFLLLITYIPSISLALPEYLS